MAALSNDWAEALSDEFKKPYYKDLYKYVKDEYSSHVVYPPSDAIFNALHYTSLKDTRVVILGQDPYHEEGQAHGLSFSVNVGVKIPPSLVNIYQEMHDDIGTYIPDNGYLVKWAKQGVLLLNTLLTVRAGAAFSHKGKGWESFTDAIIKKVGEKEEPVVFILWGAPAGKKAELIKNPNHLIIKSPHPSPLSAYRGFFGSKPFSKCNDYLKAHGLAPIDWQIENVGE